MNADVATVSSAAQELSLRLAQQELVAAFGMFALRAPDVEQVFDQVCAVAARGLGTPFAKLLEIRPDTQDFILRNGIGWKPGVVGHEIVGADLASPAGFALRTRMPVVSNHLAGESRFRTPAVLAAHGIHRAINVIVAEDDGIPFGVLEADSTDRQQFTVHDIAFLQSLANITAAAINQHRQKAAQEALLREKDILMQEVHHRVKNSLQLVQTMLYLQARSVQDEGERARLNEAAARIMSISSVHERLHEAGSLERVELGPYLSGLLTSVCTSLAGGAMPDVTVERMQLPAEHVTPIGLIAVELVTNALKYGAEPIRVAVIKTAIGVDVAVSDAGPGFPDGFDPSATRSLGMRLVAAMARTPDAVSVDRSAGQACVRVRVTFTALPGQT